MIGVDISCGRDSNTRNQKPIIHVAKQGESGAAENLFFVRRILHFLVSVKFSESKMGFVYLHNLNRSRVV